MADVAAVADGLLRVAEFGDEVGKLGGCVGAVLRVDNARSGEGWGKREEGGTYRDEGRLGERHHPVLVPEKVEELGIVRRLEVRDLEGVVRVGVHSKILDLVDRDRLVLGGGSVWRGVALRVEIEGQRRTKRRDREKGTDVGVSTESADLDTARRDRAVGVDLWEWKPQVREV